MRFAAVLGLLVACGTTDTPAPTCQQAVSHYYAAGCRLFNADGSQITELQLVDSCKQLLATAPNSCVDDLADLRRCFGDVPTPSMSNTDCDCSAEQDAILTCE